MSALDDPAGEPTEPSLRAALGTASAHWIRLRDTLLAGCGPLTKEWQWSKPAKAWSFRLKQPKRVLVYMLPQRGSFLASFSLGEAVWRAALDLDLPDAVRASVEAAPKYAEGRGVRVSVRTRKDADAVLAILELRAAG